MRFGTTTRYNRNAVSDEDFNMGRKISREAHANRVDLEGTFTSKIKANKKRDMLTAALGIVAQDRKDKATGERTAATIEGNLEGQRLSNKGKYAVATLDAPLTEAKASYYNNEARVSRFKGDDAKIGLKYSDAFYKKASTGAPAKNPINTVPPQGDPLNNGVPKRHLQELLNEKKKRDKMRQDAVDYSDATFS